MLGLNPVWDIIHPKVVHGFPQLLEKNNMPGHYTNYPRKRISGPFRFKLCRRERRKSEFVTCHLQSQNWTVASPHVSGVYVSYRFRKIQIAYNPLGLVCVTLSVIPVITRLEIRQFRNGSDNVTFGNRLSIDRVSGIQKGCSTQVFQLKLQSLWCDAMWTSRRI